MFVLAGLRGVKFHSERVVGCFFLFLFCATQTKLERTGRSGHQPKEGPCSKETYLLHETGFGRLVCAKWLRGLRRRLRKHGSGGSRGEADVTVLQGTLSNISDFMPCHAMPCHAIHAGS